ncbi:MAG: mannose-6-phosphate isomerase [Gammaproteobacteria bacterium]|jgi:mannose/cellobiose epimerase-like protein (N-acyl-D-glucosamine 2-epimerase family)|nr:mannose-6-phosphate isomerase [Gammaproteobacteria bacterium]
MKSGANKDEGVQVAAVEAACTRLVSWLLEAAYPIWSTRGIDSARGGFQERLTLSGEPTEDARRARVQPRQIYAFSRAPSLGWKGDASGAVAQGLSYFLTRFRRPDGLFRTLVGNDGTPIDDRALLYDQAFALMGFATAAPLLGSSFNLAGEAEQLRQALLKHLKRAGPGFESGLPHGPPLLSNPHMHLLEASLAWLDVGSGSEWRALADELGELALSHLIDPATGMLHESFDNSWKRTPDAPGRLVEPGHQFEWAWLLMRWGQRRADVREAALRLIDVAETHGVRGGIAINAIVNDTSIHDGSARLWPQTERLRAAALAARLYGDDRYWKMTGEAAAGLSRYFATDVAGLWYDRLTPSGEFMRETVTAGNLYHIVGAIYEVAALVRSAGK